MSHQYFQNRTFAKSSSSATSVTSYNYPFYYYWNWRAAKVSGTNSTSYSTSYEEKSELTIPSKTIVNVSEFRVSISRFVDCDMVAYPSNRKIKTLKFDKTNSPFVFYNLISYNTKSDSTRMENKFLLAK